MAVLLVYLMGEAVAEDQVDQLQLPVSTQGCCMKIALWLASEAQEKDVDAARSFLLVDCPGVWLSAAKTGPVPQRPQRTCWEELKSAGLLALSGRSWLESVEPPLAEPGLLARRSQAAQRDLVLY